MKIFTITMAPINPPYDDGAKNLMMGVATRIKEHSFYFVSSPGRRFQNSGNIIFMRSPFQRTGKHSMSILQRIYICLITVFMPAKPDIFQFFFTPQPYFSAFYKRFIRNRNKKSVQIVTSIHTLFNRNAHTRVPSLFFADRVIVHSDYSKKRLIDMGVKDVVRIYPGVETDRFKAVRSDTVMPAADAARIVYPGTYKILNDSYSFGDFLEMASCVIREIPNVKFVMACRLRTTEDAVLKRRFEILLKKRGINNFTLMDTVDDMPSLFNSCSCGIMPAAKPMVGILEIPLVLLELAALKKPVIYGNVAPLDELEKNGIGIKAGSHQARSYADSLIKCLKDKALYSAVARSSHESIMKNFTMDAVAAQYRSMYSDILTAGRTYGR
jgi:glycosyltransferase involved in cell wall biosynthesis